MSVAHPGPPPPEFEFPFAEAEAALAAIGELADELTDVVRVHRAAVDDARVNFEGRTRREFDAAFEEVVGSLGAWGGTLEIQRDQLESDIRIARARREAWETDRAIWQSRYDAWLEAPRRQQQPV